ncbi:hypothetical protein BCR33DRAFT_712049 [Rhizoclosmatium globosum]|uniref:Uncharacterized protein n=1 Tax=Rhizoclosmatium globosum TaxID=329046 RepID=A0A1Y2CXT1_9FUNG|nr:hypothetical protein BCR33DRAFT_712049 [Rhizoclosmatium globosum]|eukprot:ORY51849.1 hypothetical protein BCR33DRAFT_712049 [Rhizoclosmatium globosum]
MASPYGQFVLTQLPPSVRAGETLRCWVEMRIAATKGVKAEDDLTLELVCIASAETSVGVSASEEMWSVSRVLAPYKEGGRQKVFDKGTHSYIVHVDVPDDCFPSVPQAWADQMGTHATFNISYMLRCTFPSRDTPFSLDQPITIIQSPLTTQMLSPLTMQDRSPLGVTVTARARREQWHAERPATLFYSFKSPFKSEVPTVLIEIIQKLNLPTVSYKASATVEKPIEANNVHPLESVVATYPLPPVPANSVSNYTIRLSPVPYLAPSMFLGPIDVDYEIRFVAVFPPPAQGGNPIVEFLAPRALNILPASQEIDIDLEFDNVDDTRPADANEVPLLEVRPNLPQKLPAPFAPAPPPFSHPTLPPQQFPAPIPLQFPGPHHSVLILPIPVHVPEPVTPKFNQHPPIPVHAASVPIVPDSSESLEARLKRQEAFANSAPPSDDQQLPGYYPASGAPAQPNGVSPLIGAIGAIYGGVAPRKSADLSAGMFPPPPTSTPPPQQYNLHQVPAASADQQRLKMQQEELERIKEERAKLVREAELLRETERARIAKEQEEAQRAKEAAIAAERAMVEAAKQAELEKMLAEKKRLEDEKRAMEEAERARIEEERRKAEEIEKARVEEEARQAAMERLRIEEQMRAKALAEAKRLEEEQAKLDEIKRIEEEKRREEDERIEALRQKTNEARRALELGKKELEEQEQMRQLELELEELRREKAIAAEKLATQKQLEELNRQAAVDRLKREAEIKAEKIRLEAELQFAKERAENEKLKQEIERLKALKSGTTVAAASVGASSSHAMGSVAPSGSSSSGYSKNIFDDDEEDSEPLAKNRVPSRGKTNFYKAVGLVREQTRKQNPPPAASSSSSGSSSSYYHSAPAPPPKHTAATSPSEESMQAAYHNALDSYRNRLLTHLSVTGTPVTGREQAVARNDELMAASKYLATSSKGTALVSALEAEMRVIESEILEGYENQLFQQMRERILDSRAILQASFDAGLIHTTKELNEECKAALEGIRMDGDVSGRVYERAKANFEETVRQPLLKKVAAKERGAGGSTHAPAGSRF